MTSYPSDRTTSAAVVILSVTGRLSPSEQTATRHTERSMRTMRAKKAIKRLNKAQELLSSVVGGYGDGRAVAVAVVRDLLRPAIDSIVRARGSIEGNRTSTPSSNQHGRKTAKKRVRRLSAEGRRSLSLAARKRWAAAKRGRRSSRS